MRISDWSSDVCSSDLVYPMDDGFEIHVGVTVNHQDRTAKIDFTGTSGQHPTNYNAPKAVCVAAVLYAFRCLVDSDIPLNGGCLEPLEIVIPKGTMLDPVYPADRKRTRLNSSH